MPFLPIQSLLSCAPAQGPVFQNLPESWGGHSGEYGNDAKLVGKMSNLVMQLISIHF